MMTSPYLVGIGTGLVAAALFASFASNPSLALMFFIIPLPMLIAGMGWGLLAAQLSAFTATLLVGLLGLNTALSFGLYIALPSLILAHLTLLRREIPQHDPDDALPANAHPQIEWYPLGRIISWTALMGGMLMAIAYFFLFGSEANYQENIQSLFNDAVRQQLLPVLGADISPAELDRIISFFSRYLLPAMSAILWFLMMIANLWMAGKSVRISGQLPRPWPSIINIEYSGLLLFVFFAAIAAVLYGGFAGIMAMCLVGAIGCAYLLLGLTVVHGLLAASPFKLFVLTTVYLGILLVSWMVAPGLIILGLWKAQLGLRQSALNDPPPPAGTG